MVLQLSDLRHITFLYRGGVCWSLHDNLRARYKEFKKVNIKEINILLNERSMQFKKVRSKTDAILYLFDEISTKFRFKNYCKCDVNKM